MKEKKKKKDTDEVQYKITPKGIIWLAFEDAGIQATFEQLEEFWSSFKRNMKKAGYVRE